MGDLTYYDRTPHGATNATRWPRVETQVNKLPFNEFVGKMQLVETKSDYEPRNIARFLVT